MIETCRHCRDQGQRSPFTSIPDNGSQKIGQFAKTDFPPAGEIVQRYRISKAIGRFLNQEEWIHLQMEVGQSYKRNSDREKVSS
jgi:hypothetical protein